MLQFSTFVLIAISRMSSFTQLEPYADYKISVKAFTWKNEGEASDAVTQRTDISGPSAPIVVNLTCHNLDALYLRWKRPLEYYNSIDFYIVSFRVLEQHEFQEIKINASASTHLETAVSISNESRYSIINALDWLQCGSFFIRFQMVIPNLTTNYYYEVKVRAASISTINPRQIILGSYSEPKKVYTYPYHYKYRYSTYALNGTVLIVRLQVAIDALRAKSARSIGNVFIGFFAPILILLYFQPDSSTAKLRKNTAAVAAQPAWLQSGNASWCFVQLFWNHHGCVGICTVEVSRCFEFVVFFFGGSIVSTIISCKHS